MIYIRFGVICGFRNPLGDVGIVSLRDKQGLLYRTPIYLFVDKL